MVKRTIGLLILFLLCALSFDYIWRVQSDAPYFGNDAQYPVVFAYTYGQDSIDVAPLITRAMEEIDVNVDFWEAKRNVVIIEGPSYWLVSIAPLGNGRLEKNHYLAHDVFIMDGEYDIYLEKSPTERQPIGEEIQLHKTLVHPEVSF